MQALPPTTTTATPGGGVTLLSGHSLVWELGKLREREGLRQVPIQEVSDMKKFLH